MTLGLIAASVFAFAGWWLYRWRRGVAPALFRTAPNAVSSAPADAPSQTVPTLDPLLLAASNSALSERLWRLAYVAPAQHQPLDTGHAQVRVAIVAKLQPETLNPDYFPRRPTLMPQLMRAVDDPNAEADKLSRMIAHDPVISADVLRIANSSLYRTSPEPIESIQRAIVVCGVESLRGILATAMVRPVFRASRTNFPRLPAIAVGAHRARRAGRRTVRDAHHSARSLRVAIGGVAERARTAGGLQRSFGCLCPPSTTHAESGSPGGTDHDLRRRDVAAHCSGVGLLTATHRGIEAIRRWCAGNGTVGGRVARKPDGSRRSFHTVRC